MILDKFRQEIRQLTTAQLDALIEMYEESPSRGISDEVILECYKTEIERRFLAWEAHE